MLARILLPITAATLVVAIPTVALADFPHVVATGESLSSVATADGLSVDELAAANGISASAGLIAGNTLMIPPQAAGSYAPATGSETASGPAGTTGSGAVDSDSDSDVTGAGAAATSAPAGGGSYVVQPGDTLWAIAARDGLTVDGLAAANGLNPSGLLPSGSVLRLSGSGAAAAPAQQSPAAMPVERSSRSASSQPVGASAQASSGGPPYTTQETVSPSQVGAIAAANGVPPSLAEAIADQESGFNNALTSNANARGVMQILPGTWHWIGQTLAGPTPLSPDSASSNIRAGVLLLHSLLQSTGGNEAEAAAGYYQGLPSVLQHGVYAGTQQYVNDVMSLQRQFGGG